MLVRHSLLAEKAASCFLPIMRSRLLQCDQHRLLEVGFQHCWVREEACSTSQSLAVARWFGPRGRRGCSPLLALSWVGWWGSCREWGAGIELRAVQLVRGSSGFCGVGYVAGLKPNASTHVGCAGTLRLLVRACYTTPAKRGEAGESGGIGRRARLRI